jgi:hypothetical protein
LKVSCCGVALWALRLYELCDKRINDLDLLQGYVVGVACLHREIPCRRICIHLASRTSWSSILYPSFLFATLLSSCFCYIFISTNTRQTLLMSARAAFHWGMTTFLVTPSMCCVFICTNSNQIFWKHLCAPHCIELEKTIYVQTPIKFQLYAAEEIYSCRAQKKKTIFLHSNPAALDGMVRPQRFQV